MMVEGETYKLVLVYIWTHLWNVYQVYPKKRLQYMMYKIKKKIMLR